jgi:hypothetical protein
MAVLNNTGIRMGASGAGGDSGYQIEKSLRFNEDDSAYLNWTPGSAGNRSTFTYSSWIKYNPNTTLQNMLNAGNNSTVGRSIMRYQSSQFQFLSSAVGGVTAATAYSTPVHRDSAWYHVVWAFDTTQTTDTDRIKLYVNGVQQTFGSYTAPAEDGVFSINNNSLHKISGAVYTANQYFDGYMAEIHFIDGLQLDATSFAETNATTGQWVPKDCSEDLTYGTNGFYLKFDNASDLGEDSSGEDNNWTTNNLVGAAVNHVNTDTSATSGEIPNGGTPYWIDILPTDADIYYGSGSSMKNVHDDSTSSYVYWTGDQWTDNGNVMRARFDLRDYPTITTLRVYAGYTGSETKYDYQLLNDTKTAISGTSGTFGSSGWHTITLAGAPRYLEFSCSAGNDRRNYLGAIEVNGTILTDISASSVDVSTDSPTGNYATLDPLNPGASTLSNGNLEASGTGDLPTIIPGSGQWYYEIDGTGYDWDGTVDDFTDAAGLYNFGQRPFEGTVTTGYLTLNTHNLNTTKTLSGTYEGNGNADGPVIWMNATPATLKIDTTPSPTSSVTFSPTTVDPLAGGFKIRNASTNNGSGTTYYWLATTNRAFKYANAQSNE